MKPNRSRDRPVPGLIPKPAPPVAGTQVEIRRMTPSDQTSFRSAGNAIARVRAGLVEALEEIRQGVALLGRHDEGDEPSELLNSFLRHCQTLQAPKVLELGTKQSLPGRSTIRRDWVPHAEIFLGTDVESGADVDLVADAHRLAHAVGDESFDVIISCSTFEHLKYPTLAAHAIMRTLTVGGYLFIQTHQSFPLHSYPSDYFRFSRDALASLFGTRMGFRVHATAYEFPVKLCSRRDRNLRRMPAYLNTVMWGQKEAPTPEAYVYELESASPNG